MNEIEDRLAAAVRAEAGFGADDVGARVIRRRRRRRAGTALAAVAIVAGVGVGLTALAGDDAPDLDVAGDDGGDDDGDDGTSDGGDGGEPDPIDDTVSVDEVLEDPVGADGSTGVTSTDHLVAESPFPLCETVPRDGPAEGERYAAQEAMWQAFSEQFSPAEWPYVTGFGSPESIWGMPSVDLTRPDKDTFDRLLEFFDPGEMCVGLPSAGAVPPVPVDVPWELVSVGADDATVTVVELTNCATKAQHVDTWVHEYDDRVEIGIQAWSEANAGFNDDCPPPAEYTVELPSPLAGRDLVIATERHLQVDGPVAAGSTTTFAVSDTNRAGIDLIGDDLLARLVDDPTVRFQVSDVFADPIAGRPRAVAQDQHPMTGDAGTIRVPADVPAGTYTIQFLDHPELNGRLVVEDAVPIPDPSEPFDPANGVLVADGQLSDIHVEAIDIALPECTEDQLFGDAPDERRAELADLRDELQAEGLFDQEFLSTTSIGSVIEIGMNRRYGPTIDWIADRVEPEDVCLLFYAPPGVFTAPPESLDWVVLDSAAGSSELTIQLDQNCGLVETSMLPPAVVETDDEVLISWVAAPYFGPSRLPCLPPDEAHFLLDAPLGDRTVRAAEPSNVVAAAGQNVGVPVARVVADTLTGLGDDVMIQSVDDPSIQIQVTGVWGDPTAGPPAPIVTDRYVPADTASLHVPAGTPPGDYTWIFIEHPQLNGALTIPD
ncbi:MAG: hypothetical protein R8F63_16710 [Acidimicrobiales bacterium]|nr:hypothetical protein [Acidimicrobiales bacterium]